MLKAILDTNVFLSGFLFGGNPEKILTLWIKRKFILCISPTLKAEVINKLTCKFNATEEFTNNISLLIDAHSEKFIPKQKINLLKDPNDNFLLELAQESGADLIVSGDKAVQSLKTYKKTKIISPKEFLTLLT
jgi:uncharacterized protein